VSFLFSRLLALFIAVAAVFVAIRFGHLLRSKWSLTGKQQVVRYVSALFAAVGIWIGIGAFGHPPIEVHESPEPTDSELVCGSLEETLAKAEQEGVPAIVDFTAEWCTACDELREQTLNHPSVVQRSDEFRCAEVDLTGRMDEQTADLRDEYGVQGLPHVSFVGPDGNLFDSHTIRGLVGPEVFVERLDAVQAGVEAAGSRFEEALAKSGWLVAFLVVFVGGIATSLTPCVYPLIPVTIALFGAQGAESRTKAFLLSATYVLGIVLTYTVLGVIAAMTGSLFGAALQSPIIVGGIALLFLVLALNMMGLFEIRLPAGIQNKLSKDRQQGFVTAFVMGLIAGIIAAPCVGPILSGVLLFIAETQNALLGSALMATFATGMGLLFLVVGTFSSLINRLPASGPWMEGIKAIFAIIFVVAAFYFIAPHLPFLTLLQESPWLITADWW
jgi:thiol:disulfide interchange protein